VGHFEILGPFAEGCGHGGSVFRFTLKGSINRDGGDEGEKNNTDSSVPSAFRFFFGFIFQGVAEF
jgi:hypothetical protein